MRARRNGGETVTIGLMLLGGLALLFFAGELLVRGAVGLAMRLGVSPLMIGLTVVGFGTSMPELVTSLQAALADAPGIAIGNVVGSNIANALLILGIAAVVCPIPCPVRTVVRDGGLMVAAAAALLALTVGGALSRLDGVLLMLALAAYLVFIWKQERRHPSAAVPDMDACLPEPGAPGARSLLVDLGLVLAGLAGLIAGGRLLVDGAVDLAALAGVSDTVIGLTVVAVGTSLPELATSVVAALRRQPEIAYGNIVGSNIFNVLGIVGITAFTQPLRVPHEILVFDLPLMIGAMVVMAVFAATGGRVTRAEGAALITCYAAYLVVLAN